MRVAEWRLHPIKTPWGHRGGEVCLEVGGEGLDSDLCLQAGAGLSRLSDGAVPRGVGGYCSCPRVPRGWGAVTCTGEGVCSRCWNHVGKEGPSLRPTLPVGTWPAPELSPQASLEEKKMFQQNTCEENSGQGAFSQTRGGWGRCDFPIWPAQRESGGWEPGGQISGPGLVLGQTTSPHPTGPASPLVESSRAPCFPTRLAILVSQSGLCYFRNLTLAKC